MRGKGEGTIYQRDGRWIGQYYNNEKKRKSVSGKTRREAQKKLTKALNELAEGTYIDTPKVILENHVRDYMENYKKVEVQRTTYDSYCEYLEKHFYGSDLSQKRLDAVTVDMLQKYYNAKTKSGLSSRTVRYIHSILNGPFKSAKKRHLIKENPNEEVVLPRKVKAKIKPPTVEEVKHILSKMEGRRLYGLFRLYVFNGLRRSEGLAIQKSDINWETGEIVLRYSIGYIRNDGLEDSKRKHISVVKEDMKNDASVSSIFVDAETLQELQNVIKQQEEEKVRNADIYHNQVMFLSSDNRFSMIENDLLFTKEDGSIIPGRKVLDELHKTMEQCGLPKQRVHDLRHFFASNCMKLTKDIKLTSALCRHKQVSTTAEIYLHNENADKIEAQNMLVSYLTE